MRPYASTARWYDRIYGGRRDYAAEAATLSQMILEHDASATSLLDVACGTGLHLVHLTERFEAVGVDASPEMLAHARRRLPNCVRLHEADMAQMRLGRTFDVVICLYSSIGYVETFERLTATARRMAGHLHEGGIVIVEPWVLREHWHDPGITSAEVYDDEEPLLVRVVSSCRDGERSIVDIHYVEASPEHTTALDERHVLGLFTADQYHEAFQRAGFEVTLDIEGGFIGRGLLAGIKRNATFSGGDRAI